MSKNGPTSQFITSLLAALEYFQRLAASGDIAQMNRERKNLILPVELGLTRPETRLPAIEALLAAFPLFYACGYWQEGAHLYELARQSCPEDRLDLQARLLGRRGQLLLLNGDPRAAVAAYQDGLALASRQDDRLLVGILHSRLGHAYRELPDFTRAEKHCRQALAELEPAGAAALPYIANTLSALGRMARWQGRLSPAIAYLERAVSIRRKGTDVLGLAQALHDLAVVYQDDQQFAPALQCHQEAEQLLAGTSFILENIYLQSDRGRLHFLRQEWEQAEAVLREIDLVYLRQTGNDKQEALVLNSLGNCLLYQHRFAEAVPLFSRAIALSRQLGDSWELANAVGSLGEALAGQGDDAAATEHFQEALAILDRIPNLPRTRRLTRFFTAKLQKLGREPEKKPDSD